MLLLPYLFLHWSVINSMYDMAMLQLDGIRANWRDHLTFSELGPTVQAEQSCICWWKKKYIYTKFCS